MQLREARMDDAMDIATVHVESWQATYRGLLPQDFLDELDPVQRCAVWKRIMSGQGPRERTVVAVEAGEIVGFTNVCPSRDSDATSGTVGEVASIYLLSSLWGKGFGRQLMAGAVSALVEDEFSEATLWVLQGNERARHFYAAGGWTSDGTVKQDAIRGSVVHEVRYRHTLR